MSNKLLKPICWQKNISSVRFRCYQWSCWGFFKTEHRYYFDVNFDSPVKVTPKRLGKFLTLYAPTPQNGKTRSNNSSAVEVNMSQNQKKINCRWEKKYFRTVSSQQSVCKDNIMLHHTGEEITTLFLVSFLAQIVTAKRRSEKEPSQIF